MTQALPRIRCAEAAPYDAPRKDLPDQIWEDPELDPNDVWLYGWLARWSRLHPGWWPKQRQIAAAMHRSSQTVGRSFRKLRTLGWLAPGPDLQLTVPSARPARITQYESQGAFPGFLDDDASADRHGTKRSAGGAPRSTAGDFRPPHTPLSIREEEILTDCADATAAPGQSVSFSSGIDQSIQERAPELIRRALEATAHVKPYKSATRGKVLDAIQRFGADLVEFALNRFDEQRPEIQSWGWFIRLMQETVRLKVPILKTAEDLGRPRTKPEPPVPAAELADMLSLADLGAAEWTPGWRAVMALRALVKSGQLDPALVPEMFLAQKKTGAGSPSKSPPQPVGDPSRTQSNYTVNFGSRQNQMVASPDQLPRDLSESISLSVR